MSTIGDLGKVLLAFINNDVTIIAAPMNGMHARYPAIPSAASLIHPSPEYQPSALLASSSECPRLAAQSITIGRISHPVQYQLRLTSPNSRSRTPSKTYRKRYSANTSMNAALPPGAGT